MLPTTNILLRLEGLTVFLLSLVVYAHTGGSWLLFGLLVLAPDIFMLGYLAGARLGAHVYNLGHTYLLPATCVVIGFVAQSSVTLHIGIIWFAHIGLDRSLGYGLKHSTGFKHTHLNQP